MRRPTLKEVSKILDSENMDSETTGIGIHSSDPVVETPLRLNLDELAEYDRNPRQAANREYEALKESLRSTGSSTVTLVVTKRSGEEHYFPMMGGNTRIRVLKELYAETGDEKYFWLSCKFRPFTSEAELLIGHLAENDNRADYIFLDRARGIRAIREQLQIESNDGEELSIRKFLSLLAEHGYPKVSRASLQRFNHVLDVLYPLIPQALESGMSTKEAMRIQKLQNQIEGFCRRLFSDETRLEQLVEIFPESLSRLDSTQGIDLKELEKKTLVVLSAWIAEMGEQDPQDVHRQLLSHWALHLQDPSLTPSWPESRLPTIELDDYDDDDRPPGPGFPDGGQTDDHGPSTNGTYHPAIGSDTSRSPPPPAAPPDRRIPENESRDRKFVKLREQAWNAALSIVQEHKVEPFLKADPDLRTGWLGFWIDVPEDPGYTDQLTGPIADLWWWMFLLTETDQRLEAISRVFPDASLAQAYIKMQEHPGLDGTVETFMHLIENGIENAPDRRAFTCQFSQWTFIGMVNLMEAIRDIKALRQNR